MFTKIFGQLNKNDVAIAGGKGASLGEMTGAGILVPSGFVILSDAFERFLEETDLNVEIDSILHSVDHKEMHTVQGASEKIKALILDAKMPEDIAVETQESFKKLNSKFVAVRSSATAEDSASAAWAGQLESYLNTTEEGLLENVKRCWASLFTPRAIFYRFEKGLHNHYISVAVVVQKMVESEVSGIAFSVHPVTEDRNQLIIEAGFGLGEAIVSGQITPDSYVVEKEPRRIIDKNVYTQERALLRGKTGGIEWQNIPKEKGEKQVLSDEEILELSELILKIEKHYGFPVDVEWALEKGKLYIVQSRPITTLKQDDKSGRSKLIKLSKHFTREHALFTFLSSWGVGAGGGDQEWIGVRFNQITFLKEGKIPKVSVWHNGEEFANAMSNIKEKVNSDDKYLKKIKNEFYKYWNSILPYVSGTKKITTVQELKRIYPFLKKWWPPMAVIYVISDIDGISEEIKNEAEKIRKENQEYADKMDRMFTDFFQRMYPQYKDLTYLITPSEVFELRKGALTKEKVKEIKARDKGYVSINEDVYPIDAMQETLKKKNLILEELEKPEKVKIITGVPASPGNVKGKIRMIKYKNQLSTLKEGEVLVTEMTSPEFVPAMKKSVAIITDEGGTLCHAAIISREMNKPCIIGTKIATQVLKDGDLVEVDAERGIVKIIERSPEQG